MSSVSMGKSKLILKNEGVSCQKKEKLGNEWLKMERDRVKGYVPMEITKKKGDRKIVRLPLNSIKRKKNEKKIEDEIMNYPECQSTLSPHIDDKLVQRMSLKQ